MEKNNQEEAVRCDYCKSEIQYGRDVISVEKCVNGPRGVIPLGDTYTFCSEACVSQFFDDEPLGDLEEVPRRIP